MSISYIRIMGMLHSVGSVMMLSELVYDSQISLEMYDVFCNDLEMTLMSSGEKGKYTCQLRLPGEELESKQNVPYQKTDNVVVITRKAAKNNNFKFI